MRRSVKQASAKVSARRQLTLPKREMDRAGLHVGEVVRVEAIGPGQVLLTRFDDVLARYSGAVAAGGRAGAELDSLRDEWA